MSRTKPKGQSQARKVRWELLYLNSEADKQTEIKSLGNINDKHEY